MREEPAQTETEEGEVMTPDTRQMEALSAEVRWELESDLANEPAFWAGWIVARMGVDSLIKYLDLDNRDADSAAEILERLGFDPRGGDAPTIEDGWTEDPDWPLSDWRYEVANDDTRLGYAGWVEQNKKADSYDKE